MVSFLFSFSAEDDVAVSFSFRFRAEIKLTFLALISFSAENTKPGFGWSVSITQ